MCAVLIISLIVWYIMEIFKGKMSIFSFIFLLFNYVIYKLSMDLCILHKFSVLNFIIMTPNYYGIEQAKNGAILPSIPAVR